LLVFYAEKHKKWSVEVEFQQTIFIFLPVFDVRGGFF